MATHTEVTVVVRYFAAARAAAGRESETVLCPQGVTVEHLVEMLKGRHSGLASVLARCSYLRDGVAVRDMHTRVLDAQTIDVLPPFAGG